MRYFALLFRALFFNSLLLYPKGKNIFLEKTAEIAAPHPIPIYTHLNLSQVKP